MTVSELVHEISRLPLESQREICQAINASAADKSHLAAAARALLHDYQNDSELTAFSDLDTEDFHGTR